MLSLVVSGGSGVKTSVSLKPNEKESIGGGEGKGGGHQNGEESFSTTSTTTELKKEILKEEGNDKNVPW